MKTMSILLISLLLQACATSYQPKGFSGGFSDMKLGKDLYQVTFKGNGYTGSETVQRFFLRRCAEITLEQGYDYFALVNQEAEANQYITSSNNSGISTVTRHGRTGVIKLFKEGAQPSVAYEAKEIARSIAEE